MEIIETLNSNFNGLNSSSNLFSTPKTNHTNNLELLSFIAINQLQDQMDLVEPLQTEPIVVPERHLKDKLLFFSYLTVSFDNSFILFISNTCNISSFMLFSTYKYS